MILVLALTALAADLTVSPGDDLAAFTAALGPGDVITFEDGTYEIPGALEWSGLGTESEPILLKAADGATPVLRLAGGAWVARVRESTFLEIRGLVFEHAEAHFEAERAGGLVVDDSSDVLVQDCVIRHVGGTALYLAGDNARVTVRGTRIHDTRDGSGVYVGCGDASCWTQDSLFEGNWIHDVRGDNSRGLLVEAGGQGLTIVDNVIHRTGHQGLVLSSAELGTPNVVEGNVIWGAVHAGVRLTGAAVVRNNLVFDVDGVGISADDNDRGTMEDLVISHNTVVDTTDWGVRIDDWAGYPGMVFANNAVTNPTGLAFHVDDDDLDEGNLVTGNVMSGYVDGLDPEAAAFVPGSGWADYEDVAAWDFYPAADSALIGAGSPVSEAWVPQVDFNGLPRDGDSPEAGAYEFAGSGNPGWIVQEGFKQLASGVPSGEDLGGCGCGRSQGSEAALFLPLLLLWSRRRR